MMSYSVLLLSLCVRQRVIASPACIVPRPSSLLLLCPPTPQRKLYSYQFCSAMVINKLSKRIEDEKEIRLDLSMIKRIFLVDFLLLIIFTIMFFTCFGSFLVASTKTVQNVTLSSEGPANQIWPDSMGEYQLAEEVIHRPSGVLRWYRHVGRDDRFIMYNNFGKIFL